MGTYVTENCFNSLIMDRIIDSKVDENCAGAIPFPGFLSLSFAILQIEETREMYEYNTPLRPF